MRSRDCRNIHDFSILLTEMCHINSEDETREGRVEVPKYRLADTGIFGYSSDSDIILHFPEKVFPVSRKNYDSMRRSLQELHTDLQNEPEMVCYTTDMNYVLRTEDGDIVGFIRPMPEGNDDHLMLHFNKIEEECVEKILESVIVDGLGFQNKENIQ